MEPRVDLPPADGPLAQIDAALDALLARLEATDAAAPTDDELDAIVATLAVQRQRLEAALSRWAARWEARGRWATDGSRSPVARLARDANEAPATAARTLRRGRAVAELAHVADAWTAGEISGDHVDLLATAQGSGRATLFARDEAMLVDHCAELRHRQAQQVLRYWCQRADAELGRDGPEPPPVELQLRTTFDGTMVGSFTLGATDGAVVQESLRRIERELYHQDQRDGITRTTAERMAAALVEQAIRAHRTPTDGNRPDPLLLILAGEAQVEHLCELACGTVIHPRQLVPLLDHLAVETLIFDGADHVLATSSTRTFRGRLRRPIQARDRHCQHPSGCDVPITGCDVDHVRAHGVGGPTEEPNGRLQCEKHNRHSDLHHRQPAEIIALARRRRRRERLDRDRRRRRHQDEGDWPSAASAGR